MRKELLLLILFVLATACFADAVLDSRIVVLINGARVEYGSQVMIESLTREHTVAMLSNGPRDAVMRFGELYRNGILDIHTTNE